MKIEASVGENFIIALYSNSTTGYRWDVKYDSNFVKLTKKTFYPTLPTLIGGGGLEAFEFQPYKPGKTDILMLYKRPWEKRPIEKKVYKIKIK